MKTQLRTAAKNSIPLNHPHSPGGITDNVPQTRKVLTALFCVMKKVASKCSAKLRKRV